MVRSCYCCNYIIPLGESFRYGNSKFSLATMYISAYSEACNIAAFSPGLTGGNSFARSHCSDLKLGKIRWDNLNLGVEPTAVAVHPVIS